uniref:Uncharacterized protein n=1 Tax=Anguilla anguilla TaxID=7936 RepID=A0A0E9QRR0_ANGAN
MNVPVTCPSFIIIPVHCSHWVTQP